MLKAIFHQVQPAEHTRRKLSSTFHCLTLRICSIFQPMETALPSPSDGWHACSRRCQLALDLSVRGLHLPRPCTLRETATWLVFFACFVSCLLLSRKQISSEFATLHFVFADRRATARTMTFVEPCSIQTKKKHPQVLGLWPNLTSAVISLSALLFNLMNVFETQLKS